MMILNTVRTFDNTLLTQHTADAKRSPPDWI